MNKPPINTSDALQQAKNYYPDGLYEKLLLLEAGSLPGEAPGAAISPDEINQIIDCTQNLIREKGKAITPSQLRNIFAAVKDQEASNRNKLALLRHRLAYISARQKNREARIITEFIEDLIRRVCEAREHEERSLLSLQTLMEIMVAYHKLHHA